MLPDEPVFEGIFGLEEAKRALLLFLTAPDLKSLVLIGESGTGKSSLARMAGTIAGERIVTLPQNATWDRVFGAADIPGSLREGKPVFRPGLLGDADGGILLLDDIHLMDRSLVASVFTAAEDGCVPVERDGVSSAYRTRFRVLATLNPTEGELSPHLMDRFDLSAVCPSIDDPALRKEFLASTLRRERETGAGGESRREMLLAARRRYTFVLVPEGLMDLIADLGRSLRIAGHRGEISLARAARAAAALDGRDQVTLEDVSGTAPLALRHRRRDGPEVPPPRETGESANRENGTPEGQAGAAPAPESGEGSGDAPGEEGAPGPAGADQVYPVGEPPLCGDIFPERANSPGTTGKKGGRQKNADRGRYLRPRIPSGTISDIAFDATIRAAAPYQRTRPKGEMAIALAVRDLRVRERERKTGRTILFVVDSSGSMGIGKRMTAVKGAILSLLKDAYINRDRVALISFRGTDAEVLLQPTRSGAVACRRFEDLPTGGLTPLSRGIRETAGLIRKIRQKDVHDEPLVVFVSDGRANYSPSGADPIVEAFDAAVAIRREKARFLVIDAEYGYPRFGLAGDLAERLGGRCVRLESLSGDTIADLVRKERRT